jgi:hypothetical protein
MTSAERLAVEKLARHANTNTSEAVRRALASAVAALPPTTRRRRTNSAA